MDRDYFNTEFHKALRNGNAEEANKLIEEFVEWLFENNAGLKMHKQNNDWKLRETTLSEDRIKWLKDVAWNLSRITHKYDRLAIYEELTYQELNLLCEYEHEEDMKKIEEEERKLEDFRQKFEKFKRNIRQYNIEKASSSMIYLFPIGEA